MKHLILVLILGLTNPLAAKEYTANDYYNAGEVALKKGDAALAEKYYRKTLQLNATHANARFRLASMKDLKPEARVRARKARMAKVVLPNVVFDEETLSESLAALGAMIEKASGETLIPNFVISDPQKAISEKPVTLRLKNIPATEALKYVLSQGDARATWDAHVITVKPIAGAKAATTTTAAKGSLEAGPKDSGSSIFDKK